MTYPMLRLIVGRSLRLRDAMLAEVLSGWSGPRQRVDSASVEARDLVADLDTPPLFGEPSLVILRADAGWIRRSAAALAPLAGRAPLAGCLLIITPSLEAPGKSKDDSVLADLLAALERDRLVSLVEPPWAHAKPWEVEGLVKAWLVDRLRDAGAAVERPGEVASEIANRVGDDPDLLIGSIDLLVVAAGDDRITVGLARDLLGVTAERPAWDLSDALLRGDVRQAIGLLHAGRGLEAAQVLPILTSEIRKLLACAELDDDAAVHKALVAKGRPSLVKPRRLAQAIGRVRLQRLLTGCIQAARDLRTGGTNADLVMERLVLHARMILPQS